MDASSRYWQLCRLSLTKNKGYEYVAIAPAQELWQQQLINNYEIQGEKIATVLFRLFVKNSLAAGLCLRCYVSTPILKACQKLAALFASNHHFTYRDLLPFVLNDDGKRAIILGDDGKTQLTTNDQGEIINSKYQLFTVEILTSYKFDSQTSMSLYNWAFFHTKQNPEIKKFLAEFGFQHLSDWAMLNRVGVTQLSQLSTADRHLVEVFHAVYRRDRRQNTAKKMRKCPNPNTSQLQEMLALLHSRQVIFASEDKILSALHRVATQLRQCDIWGYRESLEVYEPDTGNYVPRKDLPLDNSYHAIASEEQELIDFLRVTLDQSLIQAIAQAVNNRLAKLQKSRRYQPFTDKFIVGIQLYYAQGKSLKEIVPILDLGNWDRARRILDPGDLLNQVRTLTIQQLLAQILAKAQDLGLTTTSPRVSYLQNLSQQIEAFADTEIFQAAAAELKAGKNRVFKSIYAEQVRLYCQQSLSTTKIKP